MWIARDKDDSLWLYKEKPRRGEDTWEGDEYFHIEDSEIDILDGPFPEVTWENSPKELIIK